MKPTCSSQEELFEGMLALLPSGNAWQARDSALPIELSVMKQFWYGVAASLYALSLAICTSYDEFFCDTADEDLDLWLEEYGLPDDCDPFANNLCAKVQTAGGTSIAYYEARAAANGFTTAMRWLKGDDVDFPGVRATLHVVIDTANSTGAFDVAHIGAAQVGIDRLGSPSAINLICVLEQIIPAHNAITYEAI